MPLTDDEKAQLLELAAKLDASDDLSGLPIVPKSVFKGRLSDKDTKRQALEADYQARMAALQQEHEAAQTKLKKLEQANMTAAEREAARVEELQTELSNAQQQAQAERAARKAEYLEVQLSNLLASNENKPANLRHSMLAAMDELRPSVADADGALSLRIGSDETVKPADAVAGWWKEQTHLHEAKGSGLPSPGAGRPPGDPPPDNPTEGLTDAQILAKGFAEFG